eukprot:2348270-Rhodomonas_salina.1
MLLLPDGSELQFTTCAVTFAFESTRMRCFSFQMGQNFNSRRARLTRSSKIDQIFKAVTLVSEESADAVLLPANMCAECTSAST